MEKDLKNILLQDLCCRLPYGVKCEVVKYSADGEMLFIRNGLAALSLTVDNVKELVTNNMYELKPYLFPLSSMTEEQQEEFDRLYTFDALIIEPQWELIDWLNKNHFDYRGLIKKSLALDATNLGIYE